ncbi:FAD-dependent oxidoreductase [Euzebya sp.]|uniref:oxidoreductase n=1 Tax=Euzebya sp. TaxID=1971409 RepID=UPI00351277BA
MNVGGDAPAAYPLALSPIRVGPVTVRNRIVRTAHATGSLAREGDDDAFIAYHAARAAGGVGLTILEVASVHPSSPAFLRAWHDGIVDRYRRLVDAVAPSGMAVFQQLWHGGHQVAPGGWRAPWSPSAVAGPKIGVTAPPMDRGQIRELVEAFAAAAARGEAGGLQGVEVHAGHGYLLHQFLSPHTNLRGDAYGGSPDGRARIVVEVLEAVRDRVGDRIAVGVRLSADDLIPAGLDPSEVAELAIRLESAGLIDFVDLSVGGYLAYPPVIGGAHEAPGYQLDHVRPVAEAVRTPTIVTGRITTLAEAEAILASGVASMVSMVRATIADPDLVAKSVDGRADEVRPCIACNQGCVGGLAAGRIGCTVNPAAGRELRADRPGRTDRPRRVLVAGGGPAGMEAARVAAMAGHHVILVERADHLGGQLALARRGPLRDRLGAFVDWQEREVRRLGVEVHLGTSVDDDVVAQADPDVVVMATGSTARTDGRQIARPGHVPPGIGQPHVITGRDVMAGIVPSSAARAVVVDDIGHHEAVSVAEVLLARGVAVEWVTRHTHPASMLDDPLIGQPARGRLRRGGVRVWPEHLLVAVDPDRCAIEDLQSGDRTDIAADLVVLVCGGVPEIPVLAPSHDEIEVVTVGDAAAVRTLQEAVREAHEVARTI